jgi:hypothetical protein
MSEYPYLRFDADFTLAVGAIYGTLRSHLLHVNPTRFSQLICWIGVVLLLLLLHKLGLDLLLLHLHLNEEVVPLRWRRRELRVMLHAKGRPG